MPRCRPAPAADLRHPQLHPQHRHPRRCRPSRRRAKRNQANHRLHRSHARKCGRSAWTDYAERQEIVFERSREFQKTALAAAALRKAPSHPPRAFFVNNETGDDSASGLSAEKAVKTLAKAVSLLQPGDTLHLAVTSQPYRETLRLGDDFGGVAGKPITIEGHGATLTGSDPLRLDGWVEAGTPGLYKSAKFLSELEEFTDEAKLMRVYLHLRRRDAAHGPQQQRASTRTSKPVGDLQPGEWTYVEAEKTFYLKVARQAGRREESRHRTAATASPFRCAEGRRHARRHQRPDRLPRPQRRLEPARHDAGHLLEKHRRLRVRRRRHQPARHLRGRRSTATGPSATRPAWPTAT